MTSEPLHQYTEDADLMKSGALRVSRMPKNLSSSLHWYHLSALLLWPLWIPLRYPYVPLHPATMALAWIYAILQGVCITIGRKVTSHWLTIIEANCQKFKDIIGYGHISHLGPMLRYVSF